MHAYELVELAALATIHGPALMRMAGRIPAASIEQYWVASKSRLDRWGRDLKRRFSALADSQSPIARGGLKVRGVLEEILTGEVLTRVWTALMCACDRRHGADHAGPIARSVMIGHLEARHRVLALLVSGPGIGAEQAVKLNQLRRRAERWTDVLIGRLAAFDDVSEFAIEPSRARDFAEDLSVQASLDGGGHAWPLVVASLRAAFCQGLEPTSPNADLNLQIAESVLAAFPPELFDSTGLPHSLWMLRMAAVTQEAQGMLDALLAEKPMARHGPADAALGRCADRLRRFRKQE